LQELFYPGESSKAVKNDSQLTCSQLSPGPWYHITRNCWITKIASYCMHPNWEWMEVCSSSYHCSGSCSWRHPF
jgi:hypothetical protein